MMIDRHNLQQRPVDATALAQLLRQGVPPVLARLYAARGVHDLGQLDDRLTALAHWDRLLGIQAAASRLADAVMTQQRVTVIADYDADGATACAVAVRGLRLLGLQAEFLVPNRFVHGYGLTPEIVRLAAAGMPELLLTVDNGIASVEGVAEASRLGMEVIVTDHHLPGEQLPACIIVNPNQPGCSFPSRHLAGVGVMFYVLLATRAELKSRGWFAGELPNLATLLDLVALGTVADVVRLDDNNRILVGQGLQRIRTGRACTGIRALFDIAGRPVGQAGAADLGFSIGPRLNAAGRLDDMTLGIQCLLTDDEREARVIAQQLQSLNDERRLIEDQMRGEALSRLPEPGQLSGLSLVMSDPAWHAGVTGILASRLKDRFHRPTICFAPAGEQELRGSGRSVRALHLRDALALVASRHPDLMLRFGGHAAAAGVSIPAGRLDEFALAFEQALREMVSEEELQPQLYHDGELEGPNLSVVLAADLASQVWGQGFPPPVFSGCFEVVSQRVLKDRHLKLVLALDGCRLDAILFNQADCLPDRIFALYQVDLNRYNERNSVQLRIEGWCAAPDRNAPSFL